MLTAPGFVDGEIHGDAENGNADLMDHDPPDKSRIFLKKIHNTLLVVFPSILPKKKKKSKC
jgi:hypothetical protein